MKKRKYHSCEDLEEDRTERGRIRRTIEILPPTLPANPKFVKVLKTKNVDSIIHKGIKKLGKKK